MSLCAPEAISRCILSPPTPGRWPDEKKRLRSGTAAGERDVRQLAGQILLGNRGQFTGNRGIEGNGEGNGDSSHKFLCHDEL